MGGVDRAVRRNTGKGSSRKDLLRTPPPAQGENAMRPQDWIARLPKVRVDLRPATCRLTGAVDMFLSYVVLTRLGVLPVGNQEAEE